MEFLGVVGKGYRKDLGLDGVTGWENLGDGGYGTVYWRGSDGREDGRDLGIQLDFYFGTIINGSSAFRGVCDWND